MVWADATLATPRVEASAAIPPSNVRRPIGFNNELISGRPSRSTSTYSKIFSPELGKSKLIRSRDNALVWSARRASKAADYFLHILLMGLGPIAVIRPRR